MKISPRKRLVLKLLDTVASIPFLVAPQYGFRCKFNLTSMLKDFTLASFPAKKPVSLVFEVLIRNLIFVSITIVQQLVSRKYIALTKFVGQQCQALEPYIQRLKDIGFTAISINFWLRGIFKTRGFCLIRS